MSEEIYCSEVDCEGVGVCQCRKWKDPGLDVGQVKLLVDSIFENSRDFPGTIAIIPEPEHYSEMRSIKKLSGKLLEILNDGDVK